MHELPLQASSRHQAWRLNCGDKSARAGVVFCKRGSRDLRPDLCASIRTSQQHCDFPSSHFYLQLLSRGRRNLVLSVVESSSRIPPQISSSVEQTPQSASSAHLLPLTRCYTLATLLWCIIRILWKDSEASALSIVFCPI